LTLNPVVRREVHYSGHVQGVGFRYTTHAIARQFDVVGFVRNLPDGRVHLVAEGDAGELGRFLDAIAERMAGHIREAKVDAGPASHAFSSFEIRV
jgi:acylphosphatase